MSATNEGLVWKEVITPNSTCIETAERDGFTYQIHVRDEIEGELYELWVMWPSEEEEMCTNQCEDIEPLKRCAHEHANAIDSAISKHRLDAERLAALVLEYQSFVQTDQESYPAIEERIEEALAAHREAIK